MPCPLSFAPPSRTIVSSQNPPSTPHPSPAVLDSHTPCVNSPPQISTLPSRTCSMPSEASSLSRPRIFVQNSSPSPTACPLRRSLTPTSAILSRKAWINRRLPSPGRYVLQPSPNPPLFDPPLLLALFLGSTKMKAKCLFHSIYCSGESNFTGNKQTRIRPYCVSIFRSHPHFSFHDANYGLQQVLCMLSAYLPSLYSSFLVLCLENCMHCYTWQSFGRNGRLFYLPSSPDG